jgi:hypothetical protein
VVVEDGEGYVRLTTSTDGVIGDNAPPARIMDGLALQIRAAVMPCEPGYIIDWRFAP